MDCILCTIELYFMFCIFFWVANQTVVSSLQVTLVLQEFFQEKVKSVNLMMEIIEYITEC